VTVFDDDAPAVANLDPSVLKALRQAATDAVENGVELYVNSGWRSRAYQDQLLRAAISQYGSEQEAARWVATADTSPHVKGNAIDIGHSDATTWLSEHGAAYGLCQIYRNEPWHFELRPDATDDGCPPLYADPTHDPRMQEWPEYSTTNALGPSVLRAGLAVDDVDPKRRGLREPDDPTSIRRPPARDQPTLICSSPKFAMICRSPPSACTYRSRTSMPASSPFSI
jgi:D-alanyl-D-alanine carboxypeptidase